MANLNLHGNLSDNEKLLLRAKEDLILFGKLFSPQDFLASATPDFHVEVGKHLINPKIQQLGLADVVYPGANHTRFQHALGTGHLMWQAIQVLRSKGIEITENYYNNFVNYISEKFSNLSVTDLVLMESAINILSKINLN